MMWDVCADDVRDDDERCLPGSSGQGGEESLYVRRIPDGGMSGRTIAALAAVMVGVLFMAACQPAVNVSRVPAVRTGLPLAPKDPPLLPVDASGKPMHPSVAEGAKVFSKTQCLICHGPEGLGNGPAAGNLKSPGKNLLTDFLALFGIRATGEQLPSRPANFHNLVQMRLNSPFNMYETVTRGRPNTAMPAFGPKPAYGAVTFGVKLTDEDRWNVIFFEWAFTTSPAQVARGKRIYETQVVPIHGQGLTCADCHGVAGDGRGRVGLEIAKKRWNWARGLGPGIFTDVNLIAQRKPTDLFQVTQDGLDDMPSYRGVISDDDIWAVVSYIWTFIYTYPQAPR